MSDEFEELAEEELHSHAHDPDLQADVPASMREGNRGANNRVLFGGIAVLVIAIVAALAFTVRGFFSHPPANTNANNGTGSGFQSAMQGGMGTGFGHGMLFGGPGGQPAAPQFSPLPSASPSPAPGSPQPLHCAPNYHVIQVQGYPPTCVLDGTGPSTTPTQYPNGQQPQAPTPSPTPPQEIDVGQAPSQQQQAQADINARGGTPTPAASGSPLPVYENGRVVAYIVPPTTQTQTQNANFANTSGQENFANTSGQGNTQNVSSQGSTQTEGIGYVRPTSEDQIGVGTVIPSALISDVNSDVPGVFIGQVTACVNDAATHRHCVIPPGTLEMGEYDSHTLPNQTGLPGAITYLRFPDGREFDLGRQNVTDAMGSAGMTGHVDAHRNVLINQAILLTTLGAASAALSPTTSSIYQVPTVGQQIQSAAGAQISNIGSRLIGAQLERGPTITIKPPYQFNVIVTRDLPLDRYEVRPQRGSLVPIVRTPAPAPIVTPVPEGPTRFCCR